MNAELESNKAEKLQKDVFKRFFSSLGFENLDGKSGSAGPIGPSASFRSSLSIPSSRPDSPPLVLSDLFP